MTAPQQSSPPAPTRRGFHVEEALAALIMAVLCLITLGNVLTRYFTSISFAFTEEFSVFLVVVMTFVGAATAFSRGSHLSITALVDRLPERGRILQGRFEHLCGLALFGILTWPGRAAVVVHGGGAGAVRADRLAAAAAHGAALEHPRLIPLLFPEPSPEISP